MIKLIPRRGPGRRPAWARRAADDLGNTYALRGDRYRGYCNWANFRTHYVLVVRPRERRVETVEPPLAGWRSVLRASQAGSAAGRGRCRFSCAERQDCSSSTLRSSGGGRVAVLSNLAKR